LKTPNTFPGDAEMENRLQKNTVVLDIRTGMPGVTRKASMENIEVNADKDSLKLTKEVLRSTYLAKARTAVYEAKKLVKRYALKSPFREGTYLLPVPALDVIYPNLEEAEKEFNEYADKFVDDFDNVVEDARKRLREQFRQEDYPPPQSVRRMFNFGYQLLSFDTPEEGILGKSLYKQELEKARQRWQQAEVEVTMALRESMKDLIDHMLERLTPAADGSVKTFKGATVGSVKEFLETFGQRNVLGDSDLELLVAKAQRILKGKDADKIRENEDIRVVVTQGMKKLSKGLDELIVTSKRKMSFED